MRQRHHAGPDPIGDLHWNFQFAARSGDDRGVGDTQPGRVLGVDLQSAAVAATVQRRQVMHPAVVGPQVPSTDQQEPAVVGSQRGVQPGQVGQDRFGSQFDCARGGSEHLRNARGERTQVDTVRVVFESLQVQAAGIGAERITERSQSQHHVQPALVAGSGREHRGELTDGASGHRRVRVGHLLAQHGADDLLVDEPGIGIGAQAHQPQRQPAQDLHLARPAVRQVEHRRRIAGGTAHRHARQCDVEVRCVRRRGRRQDDIGVPGGLVEVGIDRDHELQLIHRPGQPPAIGCRQHRVAGDRHQRPDLPRSRGLDLLGQQGGRQFGGDLRAP